MPTRVHGPEARGQGDAGGQELSWLNNEAERSPAQRRRCAVKHTVELAVFAAWKTRKQVAGCAMHEQQMLWNAHDVIGDVPVDCAHDLYTRLTS